MDKVRSIGKVTKMGKWRLKLEDGRHSHVLRYILLQGAAIVEGQRVVWQANGRKRQKGPNWSLAQSHPKGRQSPCIVFLKSTTKKGVAPSQAASLSSSQKWQVMILSSLVWRNCWMFQQGVWVLDLSFLKKRSCDLAGEYGDELGRQGSLAEDFHFSFDLLHYGFMISPWLKTGPGPGPGPTNLAAAGWTLAMWWARAVHWESPPSVVPPCGCAPEGSVTTSRWSEHQGILLKSRGTDIDSPVTKLNLQIS